VKRLERIRARSRLGVDSRWKTKSSGESLDHGEERLSNAGECLSSRNIGSKRSEVGSTIYFDQRICIPGKIQVSSVNLGYLNVRLLRKGPHWIRALHETRIRKDETTYTVSLCSQLTEHNCAHSPF
jgi:hypothetical protein